jgi:hypothetical protein
MPVITYSLSRDTELNRKAHERHRESLEQLKRLGFDEMPPYQETIFRFSYLILAPAYWMMHAKGEAVKNNKLAICTVYPLAANREHCTYAQVNALNVKFYTLFNDGTLIVTANPASEDVEDHQRQFYKYVYNGSIEDAWKEHQRQIQQCADSGLEYDFQHSFDQYAALSQRELRYGQGALILMGGCWTAMITIPILLIVLLVALPQVVLSILPESWQSILGPELSGKNLASWVLLFASLLVLVWTFSTLRNAYRRRKNTIKLQSRQAPEQEGPTTQGILLALLLFLLAAAVTVQFLSSRIR